MSDAPTTDAADRLETNLAAFISGILSLKQVKHQVLVTNSFDDRSKPVIVEIDAHSDLANTEMGLAYSSGLIIRISGEIDRVPSKSHKAIVAAIKSQIWPEPKPDSRLLWASPAALAAVNKMPGQQDIRPASDIHLWDMASPSSSLGAVDSTADTILACRATFTGSDWQGSDPYGQ